MTTKGTVDQLAQRYIDTAAKNERLSSENADLRALLLNIEGALLGYWTDLPEAVVEELRVRIRAALGPDKEC